MKTEILTVFAALLCGAAICTPIKAKKDFTLEKMAGKWYLVGFATNAAWFVNHKAGMKMGSVNMVATPEGDLEMSYSSLKEDGSCWRMTNLAKKTDTPGRFTFVNERWNNENDMRVVDVQYDDYALVHTIKTQDGGSEVLNKLYSRSPEVSAALKQTFQHFSLDTGVLPCNIAMLPKNGECTEA